MLNSQRDHSPAKNAYFDTLRYRHLDFTLPLAGESNLSEERGSALGSPPRPLLRPTLPLRGRVKREEHKVICELCLTDGRI